MAENQSIVTLITQSDEFLRNRHLIYKPLNPTRQEIRLMHIQPGCSKDDIHINLHCVDLVDKPFYETISYAWGDLSVTKQVYIHDLACNVTVNQYAALHRLRLPDKSKILWMDLICIDQANLQERAEQVSIMGDIYANGARTDVWLGEISEDLCTPMSDEAWDKHVAKWKRNESVEGSSTIPESALRERLMISLLQTDGIVERARFILYQLAAGVHFSDLPFATLVGEEVVPRREWYDALSGLLDILQYPWWSRVWVLQEVLLCKGDPNVLFGHLELPLNVFTKAAGRFMEHILHARCCVDYFMSVFFSLDEVIDHLYRIESMNIITSIFEPGSMSLHKAVQLTGQRSATDVRDHVYGVLGLTGPNDRINIDYNLSIEEVFVSATWHIMKSGNTFTWLDCGALPDSIRTPNIPTWSIDLVDIDRVAFKFNNFWEMYEMPDWERTRCSLDLELPANHLAEIQLVLARPQRDEEATECRNMHNLVWGWLSGLEDVGIETTHANWTAESYHDEKSFTNFFSTLFRDLTLADHFDVIKESKGQVGSMCKKITEQDWQDIWRMWTRMNDCTDQGTDSQFPGKDLILTVTAFLMNSKDCTLAITTEGKLCQVPEQTEIGDFLYHIRACCPPLVLRGCGKDAFQVVGAAYHEGMMGSQGWRQDEEIIITLC